MTHKQTTKKSQGDEATNSKNLYKDNSNVIVEQPGNPRCPVKSYKKYMSRIDHSVPFFFQQPKKNIHLQYDEIWYHKKVFGKETIATWLKTISEKSNCSKLYTNHTLRRTTATAMDKSGKFTIQQIASVTGQRNYQSLESYLQNPDEEDHIEFCDALFDYTDPPVQNDNSEQNPETPPTSPPKVLHDKSKLSLKKKKISAKTTATTTSEQVAKRSLVDITNDNNHHDMQVALSNPELQENNTISTQEVVIHEDKSHTLQANMTMSKIPNIFRNSTFNNCTINFQMPQ